MLQVGYACYCPLDCFRLDFKIPLPTAEYIDADFFRMQRILLNRTMPAFKRYVIGTEPAHGVAKA
jgi:hypothetical protein